MEHIAAFERHNGRVPNFSELAKSLGWKGSELRAFIRKNLLNEKIDGTSAFSFSLREILMGAQVYENGVGPATPPVAVYSHYKYEHARRAREARKAAGQASLKELRLRYSISSNDYEVKLAKVKKFLEKGASVKLTVVFKERELEHLNLGMELLEKFAVDLDEVAVWVDDASFDGEAATMLFSPI